MAFYNKLWKNTMANSLTPAQKLAKQQRTVLKTTIGRLKGQFSFHNIHTWSDVYRIVGYGKEYIEKHFNNTLSLTVSWTELLAFCDKLNTDLENTIDKTTKETNDTNIPTNGIHTVHQEISEDIKSSESNSRLDSISNQTTGESCNKETAMSKEDSGEPKEKFLVSPNESPNLSLYYFQKDSTMKILKGYGI